MTTQLKKFLCIPSFTSNVCDKICTVDLHKVNIPALRAPDVLQGRIRTRITGLLVFSNGAFAKFERHADQWCATMTGEFPRETLEKFGEKWERKLTVEKSDVSKKNPNYVYFAHSFDELTSLVELLKQIAGPCVATDGDLFPVQAAACGWIKSTIVPPFAGKGCVRTEIRALRAAVQEISVTTSGAVWSYRHETCLSDNEFGTREAYLLRMFSLAEGTLGSSDPDLARVKRELAEIYQERAVWSERMLDLDVPREKEALVLLTLDLERSHRQRARFLKKLGRTKHARSALAHAASVVPVLLERLKAAAAESAKKYAEEQHPWWGRRLAFFREMQRRFYVQSGDSAAAARCQKEVAALRGADHQADEWVERWVK